MCYVVQLALEVERRGTDQHDLMFFIQATS